MTNLAKTPADLQRDAVPQGGWHHSLGTITWSNKMTLFDGTQNMPPLDLMVRAETTGERWSHK